MFLHLRVILFSRGVGFPACITGHRTSIGGGGGGLSTGGWADPPPGTRKVGGTHPIEMLSCLAAFLAKSALLSLDSPGDPTLTDKLFLDFMFFRGNNIVFHAAMLTS